MLSEAFYFTKLVCSWENKKFQMKIKVLDFFFKVFTNEIAFNRNRDYLNSFIIIFAQILLNVSIGFYFFMDGTAEAVVDSLLIVCFTLLALFMNYSVEFIY